MKQAHATQTTRNNPNRRLRARALLALVLFALAGFTASCHQVIIKLEPGLQMSSVPPTVKPDNPDTSYSSVALGIIEYSKPVQAKCDKGVKFVKIERSIIDCILHFFIGGFYTTRSVMVFCK